MDGDVVLAMLLIGERCILCVFFGNSILIIVFFISLVIKKGTKKCLLFYLKPESIRCAQRLPLEALFDLAQRQKKLFDLQLKI